MKKTRKLIAVLAVAAGIGSLQAKIGDTLEQATQRYGPVVGTMDDADLKGVMFNYEGFLVIAHLRDNKVDIVMYANVDLGNQKAIPLTSEQVQKFLKINHDDGWKPVNPTFWKAPGMYAK